MMSTFYTIRVRKFLLVYSIPTVHVYILKQQKYIYTKILSNKKTMLVNTKNQQSMLLNLNENIMVCNDILQCKYKQIMMK